MPAQIQFVLLLAALLFPAAARSAEPTTPAPAATVNRIGVEEYDKLRADTNNVILDVRSVAEFEKGRIPRAINIDINSKTFAERTAALDRNKTYLVNCAVGMRSAKASKKLATMGFKNLYDLGPGFDGWKKAGKPIEK